MTESAWIDRLAPFGVTHAEFSAAWHELSTQFGKPATVNDTVWRILNNLVITHAKNENTLAEIYREMAALAASEGKDPSPYLREARGRTGGDALARGRKLRIAGDLNQADLILLRAEPSPAVLGELRKIASARARAAKKAGDWAAVARHLDWYERYAAAHRDHCIKTVNQGPPLHTKSDAKLLQEARERLKGQADD